MKLAKFISSEAGDPGQEIELNSDQTHVMVRVLRLNVGQEIMLLDGRGGMRQCAILEFKKHSTKVKVIRVMRLPRPRPDLTLYYAMPKGEKASEVIRSCVEWGVNRIVFLASEFAVAKPAKGQSHRWERVAKEAMRQSGNPYLPELVGPLPLDEMNSQSEGELRLVFDTDIGAGHLRDLLHAAPSHVSLAVGPEGGWSSDERSVFRDKGFRSVRMGPYILRTEHAAQGAVAIIRGLYSCD